MNQILILLEKNEAGSTGCQKDLPCIHITVSVRPLQGLKPDVQTLPGTVHKMIKFIRPSVVKEHEPAVQKVLGRK